jgi:hypothetical protein
MLDPHFAQKPWGEKGTERHENPGKWAKIGFKRQF